MLLAIDVGNTQTVIGAFDGATLSGSWRIASNDERTADELALIVKQLLALCSVDFPGDIDGVAICSGVPRVTASLRDLSQRYVGIEPVVLGAGVKTGMPILYEDPRAVGPDRIANAVGALALYEPPMVVVDFGTATTFDAISERGEYLGGAIVPGIEISLEALYSRAALLRRVELVEPRAVIGRTTIDSIQSGAIYGYSSLVDGLVRRMEDELGRSTVLATGGLSGVIGPLCASIHHLEPDLTLNGLRLVYERNT